MWSKKIFLWLVWIKINVVQKKGFTKFWIKKGWNDKFIKRHLKFKERILDPNILWLTILGQKKIGKNNVGSKKIWPKKIVSNRIFGPRKILIFFGPKKIKSLVQNNVWFKKLLDPKKFGPNMFWIQKVLELNLVMCPKFFLT